MCGEDLVEAQIRRGDQMEGSPIARSSERPRKNIGE